jgi:hypothetical protein
MNRWLEERQIGCPFCSESITILLDVSAGSQQYIEDCQVCCRPMQVTLDVNDGEIASLQVDCAS